MSLFSRAGTKQQQPETLAELVFAFGPRARRTFKTATEISNPYRQIDSGAVLAALLDEPAGAGGVALFRSGVRMEPTLAAMAALEPLRDDPTAKRPMAPVVYRIYRAAHEYQRRRKQGAVTTDLLLEALLNETDSVALAILASQSINAHDVRRVLRSVVASGETSDDIVFRVSETPVVEIVDLDFPADLVWALIEPPENVPLLDPNVISGERRFDTDGREIHVLHTRNAAPADVIEYLVTIETPGRRATIVQSLPESPRAVRTTFALTPFHSGSRLQLESFVEVGSLRRRELATAEPELRQQLRTSLDNTRQVLQNGWRPNAGV